MLALDWVANLPSGCQRVVARRMRAAGYEEAADAVLATLMLVVFVFVMCLGLLNLLIAYLLLRGKLPNRQELDAYKKKLQSLRGLPAALKTVLEQIPKDAHPMDVMRTGCSMLGNLETEESFDEQQDVADRLLAVLPSIICYWYRFSHDGVRIDTDTDDADDVMGLQARTHDERNLPLSTFPARTRHELDSD